MILETHRDKLDLITKFLLERETLDGRDVEDLMKHGRIRSEEERQELPASVAVSDGAAGLAPAG